MKDLLELNDAYGDHFAKLQQCQREGDLLTEEEIEFIKYYASELLYRLIATEEVSCIMKRLKDR